MQTTRRNVSSEDFTKAYGDLNAPMDALTPTQLDNRKVMRKVTNKYSNSLTEDEILECVLQGLWRCLSYHDDNKGQKFTTSLWTFTDWECKRKLRTKRTTEFKKNTVSISDFDYFDVAAPTEENKVFIKDCIEQLPPADKELIEEYYFQRMTMEEIGQKHKFSKEAARQKIGKALNRLREMCSRQS